MGTNPCLCLQPLLLLIASLFHGYCCGMASQSHPSDTECQGICRGQGSGGLFLSHSAAVGSAWKTHLKAHSLLSRVSTSSCDLPLPLSLVAPGFLCSPWCLSTQDGNSRWKFLGSMFSLLLFWLEECQRQGHILHPEMRGVSGRTLRGPWSVVEGAVVIFGEVWTQVPFLPPCM